MKPAKYSEYYELIRFENVSGVEYNNIGLSISPVKIIDSESNNFIIFVESSFPEVELKGQDPGSYGDVKPLFKILMADFDIEDRIIIPGDLTIEILQSRSSKYSFLVNPEANGRINKWWMEFYLFGKSEINKNNYNWVQIYAY